MFSTTKFSIFFYSSAVVILLSVNSIETSYAQGASALEEIIVTAQRREQSLQDVPISLEVVRGEDILQQGYRDMSQLAAFTPTLNISPDTQNQTIMIRGVGTQGSNFGFEQAVPTFIDGVHYGRASQIKGAFLDIERVEVMRGPQPVFFGQNATAGALSITTRKPGQEWEGYLIGEAGNNDIRTAEFGAGGPATESFGVRFAGKYDSSSGFLTDIVTREKYPSTENFVGRATFVWTPTDVFNATLQLSYADAQSGGRANMTGLSGKGIFDDRRGDGAAAAALAATGTIQGIPVLPLKPGINDQGFRHGPLFITPLPSISIAMGGSPHRVPDMTRFSNGVDFAETGLDFSDKEFSEPWSSYLLMNYEFGNGLQLSSQTGFSHYYRVYMRSFGSGGPFALNPLSREEDLDQWSQEFRISSPVDETLVWMIGAYYQSNDLNTSSNSWRATQQTTNQLRRATSYDDAKWMGVFAAVTYNFNDQLSLDVGARLSDVHKDGGADLRRALWIVEGGGPVTASGQVIIGYTPFGPPDSQLRGEFDTSEFDPQVVLRWRPNDDISTYAKWAQSFKAGGFDTAVTNPPAPEAFEFDSEYAEIWEIGAKTTWLDEQLSFDINVFTTNFDGLQLSAFDEIQQRNRTSNVGKQRVRGSEFSGRYAVSSELTVGISGALLDGEMISFPGANCNSQEVSLNICTGTNNTTDRTGEKAIRTPDWQIALNFDYLTPVFSQYQFGLNGKFIASDGYILDDNFEKIIVMDKHTNLNLSLNFGDIDDRWRLSVWGRNLLEPLPTYHPENDLAPNGLVNADLHSNMFKTYGVQVRFNY